MSYAVSSRQALAIAAEPIRGDARRAAARRRARAA
jgi:hypothetical protein